MPLNPVDLGVEYTIQKTLGKEKQCHHLESLDFVAGGCVPDNIPAFPYRMQTIASPTFSRPRTDTGQLLKTSEERLLVEQHRLHLLFLHVLSVSNRRKKPSIPFCSSSASLVVSKLSS